jgi:hypothetical protein
MNVPKHALKRESLPCEQLHFDALRYGVAQHALTNDVPLNKALDVYAPLDAQYVDQNVTQRASLGDDPNVALGADPNDVQ